MARSSYDPPTTKPETGDGHREFDRFEDLTRKLVRVPKKEIREAEAKRKK